MRPWARVGLLGVALAAFRLATAQPLLIGTPRDEWRLPLPPSLAARAPSAFDIRQGLTSQFPQFLSAYDRRWVVFAPRLIATFELLRFGMAISPDGTAVAYVQGETGQPLRAFRYDVATGQSTRLDLAEDLGLSGFFWIGSRLLAHVGPRAGGRLTELREFPISGPSSRSSLIPARARYVEWMPLVQGGVLLARPEGEARVLLVSRLDVAGTPGPWHRVEDVDWLRWVEARQRLVAVAEQGAPDRRFWLVDPQSGGREAIDEATFFTLDTRSPFVPGLALQVDQVELSAGQVLTLSLAINHPHNEAPVPSGHPWLLTAFARAEVMVASPAGLLVMADDRLWLIPIRTVTVAVADEAERTVERHVLTGRAAGVGRSLMMAAQSAAGVYPAEEDWERMARSRLADPSAAAGFGYRAAGRRVGEHPRFEIGVVVGRFGRATAYSDGTTVWENHDD